VRVYTTYFESDTTGWVYRVSFSGFPPANTMSTPGSIIPLAYDPDQSEDTPGETVSIVYQIDTQTTATLSYDGTRDSFRPYRHNIKIDLGGRFVSEAHDKDFLPYRVAIEFTRGLNDETIDLFVWMDKEHVNASLAIAIRQVIELQRLSVQGQQEPSRTSSQPTNGPGESLDNSASGSIGFSGILSTLVGALRAPSK
jgi:hypothetical protein